LYQFSRRINVFRCLLDYKKGCLEFLLW
jgi:hypothetical protein